MRGLTQQAERQNLREGIFDQCQSQAQELSDLLDSLNVGKDKGRLSVAKAAFKSLRRAERIEKVSFQFHVFYHCQPSTLAVKGHSTLSEVAYIIGEKSFLVPCVLCSDFLLQLQSTLDRLIQLLGLQLQVEAKKASDQTGTDVSSLLKLHSGQLELLQALEVASESQQSLKTIPDESQPVWIVPLSRNPKFVGREDLITEVQDQLAHKHDSTAIAVLYGLGGVGYIRSMLVFAGNG